MRAPACDLHTHTALCDGADTPEEMAARAQSLGLRALGISGHSPTDAGCSWALADVDAYVERIRSLRGCYGEMAILCGLEYDSAWTLKGRERFDYIIGSVHYLTLTDGRQIPVDESREITERAVDEHFGGSPVRYAEAYFAELASMIERISPDIVGHIDLPTKFDAGTPIFDEESLAYRRAALCALDVAIDRGATVEVNLGAILRAKRGRSDIKRAPYPSEFLLRRLLERGGAPILSSDAHRAEDIAGEFAWGTQYLSSLGFRELTAHNGKDFIRIPIGK